MWKTGNWLLMWKNWQVRRMILFVEDRKLVTNVEELASLKYFKVEIEKLLVRRMILNVEDRKLVINLAAKTVKYYGVY